MHGDDRSDSVFDCFSRSAKVGGIGFFHRRTAVAAKGVAIGYVEVRETQRFQCFIFVVDT